MKKSLIYSLPLFLIILFYQVACSKDKIKKGYHGVLIGKYISQVQIYNQTEFHCVDKDKIKDTFVIEEIYYVNDHQLAIKPSISLSYQLKDLPFDTVNFVVKTSWAIGDSILVYNNYNNNRISYLAISDDSLYSEVLEPCRFNYKIRGKKIK
jgi:hypothetical protein